MILIKCTPEEKGLGGRAVSFFTSRFLCYFVFHADWSTCQLSERAVCGSGMKTRMLDCVRSDGKSVDLKFCEEVCVLLFPFQSSLVINESDSSVVRVQTGCCWCVALARKKNNLSFSTNGQIKYFSLCFLVSFSWDWTGSGR